ncbi:MAG: 50S ribosomal protein L35 [Bacteroidales bacterium]|nr:50S ribosomal protein L35 [Candidatus Colimorpha pelethequi]MCQ2262358.1 50S ribosomal protein L35 [Bacteroidales bacterium]
MPKLKTKAAAKKRFAFTGTGKIKRKHAYHSHILTKKETTQKRNLDHTAMVSNDDVKRVKRMILSSGM